MYYLITDTHIGHANIIRLCNRPDNFEELVFSAWMTRVQQEDTVIHLGDVAWDEKSLKRFAGLPGRRILIKGNHDSLPDSAYMEAGFMPVCSEMLINFDGMRVLFSHRPKFGHTEDINIHGHQHDLHREDLTRLYLPLALEHMGYRPIAMNHDFLSRLHSWVDRAHIPTIEEIIALRQNHIGRPTARDLYGNGTPDEFVRIQERRSRIEAILNTPEFYRCKENSDCWRANEKYAYGKITEQRYRAMLCDLLAGKHIKT